MLIFEKGRRRPARISCVCTVHIILMSSTREARPSASISSSVGAIPSHIAPFAAINAAQRPYKSSQNARFVLYCLGISRCSPVTKQVRYI